MNYLSIFICWHTAPMQHITSWWRHQMETFAALLDLCAGNSPVSGEFPSQRPVTRSFDVLFDIGLKKRLSKQLKRRWFETPSRSLWRHRNVAADFQVLFAAAVYFIPMEIFGRFVWYICFEELNEYIKLTRLSYLQAGDIFRMPKYKEPNTNTRYIFVVNWRSN